MRLDDIDLKFFENREDFDGDLKVGGGDLELTNSSTDTKMQEVMNRCQTNNPDWFRHYNVGADLEDIRGMVQAEETANLGANKILQALTHDGKFRAENIKIEPVPTDMDEITYFIFIDIGKQEPLVIEYPIEL